MNGNGGLSEMVALKFSLRLARRCTCTRRNMNAPARSAANKAPMTTRAMMPLPIPLSLCESLPVLEGNPVAVAEAEVDLDWVTITALVDAITSGVFDSGVASERRTDEDVDMGSIDVTTSVVGATEVIVGVALVVVTGATVLVMIITGVGVASTKLVTRLVNAGTRGMDGRSGPWVVVGCASSEVGPIMSTEAVESLDWRASDS